jgi:hypothetical protein
MNKTSKQPPSKTASAKPKPKPNKTKTITTTTTKPNTKSTNTKPHPTKPSKPLISTSSQGTPHSPIFPGGTDPKPIPPKTVATRKARTAFLKAKQRRELGGTLGSNDNANTGSGLEVAGYSPYVLS